MKGSICTGRFMQNTITARQKHCRMVIMIDLDEFSPTASPLLALPSWIIWHMKSQTVGSTLACNLLTDTSSTVCSVTFSWVVNSLSVLRHLAASLMHIVLLCFSCMQVCSQRRTLHHRALDLTQWYSPACPIAKSCRSSCFH